MSFKRLAWVVGTVATLGAVRLGAQDVPLSADSVRDFFDRAWVTLSADGKIPGGVVAVVHGHEPLLVKGYGTRDIRSGEPIDAARTLFRIGSVSKLFTAIVALQLADEDKLDLYGEVNDYLDEIRVPDTFEQPVRIWHLLTHLGGFDAHVSGYIAYSNADTDTPAAELNRQLSRPRRPGLVAAYDNQGLGLLGYVSGMLHGSDFPTAVRERIFEPLGMKHSVVGVPDERVADVAACHALNAAGEVVTCRATVMRKGFRGAGDVSTTGADMSRFMLALLNGGELDGERVLSADKFQAFTDMDMNRLHPALPGYGYIIYERDLGGRRAIGHGGGYDGFSTELFLFPESKTGVFISLETYPGLPYYANLSFLLKQNGRQAALAEANGYALMAKVTADFAKTFLAPTAITSRLTPPASRSVTRDEFTGIYHFARSNAGPLLDRLTRAMSPVRVRRSGAEALTIGGAGPFVESQPYLFVREDTGTKFAFVIRDGNVLLSTGGVSQFIKVPWHADPRFSLIPLVVGLLVLLTAGGYALARRKSRERRWLGLLMAGGAVAIAAGAALEMEYYPVLYFAHGVTAAMVAWRLLIGLGWLALVIGLGFLAMRWTKVTGWRSASATAESAYVALLGLSSIVVVVLAVYWGALGK